MERSIPKRLGLALAATAVLLAGCGSTNSKPSATPSGLMTLAPKADLTPTESASPILSRFPACTPAQLNIKYYGGGEGAGNNFGTVAVLNRSGIGCVWRGGVSVVPLTRSQQIMGDNATAEANASAMTATADGILLSPHGYVVQTQSAPAGDSWAEIEISGDARDDPKSPSGNCAKANQVTPAYWGIATLGQKFTVLNYDQANIRQNEFIGVTACRGIFNRLTVSASY